MENITPKDMAMSIYTDLATADDITPDARDAFYRFLQMKIEYLKGLVKEQQHDNTNKL